jgi:hypothetical protein
VLHLFLAVIWLAGAIVVFAFQALYGENASGYIPWFRPYRVSIAWVMLVLMLYSLAYWYAQRSIRAQRQAMRDASERQLREAMRPPTEGGKEPDLNFRFTDDPPGPAK